MTNFLLGENVFNDLKNWLDMKLEPLPHSPQIRISKFVDSEVVELHIPPFFFLYNCCCRKIARIIINRIIISKLYICNYKTTWTLVGTSVIMIISIEFLSSFH